MTRYTPPTAKELHAADRRSKELRDTMDAAAEAYFRASREWQDATAEYLRLAALSRPVREYVVDRFTRYSFRKPPTARVVAPHHDPAEVESVLDELVAEGLIAKKGRGFVALFEGDRP